MSLAEYQASHLQAESTVVALPFGCCVVGFHFMLALKSFPDVSRRFSCFWEISTNLHVTDYPPNVALVAEEAAHQCSVQNRLKLTLFSAPFFRRPYNSAKGAEGRTETQG